MIESLLADREILYFIKMQGCIACEAAIPEMEKFITRHPGTTVLTIDADGPFPERLGIKIRATPTYLFRRGDEGVTKSGVLKCSEIEKWIRGIGGRL